MKAHPIIMGSDSVAATLKDLKTQTRRVIKIPQKVTHVERVGFTSACPEGLAAVRGRHASGEYGDSFVKCPYGVVGDHLWVKETYVVESNQHIDSEAYYPPPFTDGRPVNRVAEIVDVADAYWEQCHYKATDPNPELVNEHTDEMLGWRSPRFMPRWASRLTLELLGVRVERLQEISEEDALAEGVASTAIFGHGDTIIAGEYARERFPRVWDALNAKRGYSWESNPFVWALTFRRITSQEAPQVSGVMTGTQPTPGEATRRDS